MRILPPPLPPTCQFSLLREFPSEFINILNIVYIVEQIGDWGRIWLGAIVPLTQPISKIARIPGILKNAFIHSLAIQIPQGFIRCLH